MTLKHIHHFLLVQSHRHVTQAAEELHISQAALSTSLKSLEKELGCSLFDRRGKTMVLTEKGRKFYTEVTPLYQEMMRLKEKMQKGHISHYKMAASQSIGTYLLPPTLTQMSIHAPQTKVTTSIQNSSTILDRILSHTLDFGLVEGVIRHKEIASEIIAEDELIVVTGCADLAKASYIDTLATYPWVLREDGSGTKEVFDLHLPPTVAITPFLQFDSNEAILQAIKHQPLLTCLSRFVIRDMLGKGLYHVPVQNLTFKRHLFLVYHHKRQQNSEFRDMIDTMKEGIRQILAGG